MQEVSTVPRSVRSAKGIKNMLSRTEWQRLAYLIAGITLLIIAGFLPPS